jgi:hypothetical protein
VSSEPVNAHGKPKGQLYCPTSNEVGLYSSKKGEKMKKGVIILGIVIGLVVLGVVLLLTNPLTDVAEEFLALISQNRFREASQLHISGIRDDIVNRTKVEDVYRNSVLTKYKSVSWHNRRVVDGNWGLLEGIMETSDALDMEIYIQVEFMKENGDWKISYIEFYPIE